MDLNHRPLGYEGKSALPTKQLSTTKSNETLKTPAAFSPQFGFFWRQFTDRKRTPIPCAGSHLRQQARVSGTHPGINKCNREWLLKNSLARNPPKFQRARRPYKRRSRFWWTFSIPRLGPFFQKRGFFNSHGIYRQLTQLPSSRRLGLLPVCRQSTRNMNKWLLDKRIALFSPVEMLCA